MQYKNGREAKQGDQVVYVAGGHSTTGILHSIDVSGPGAARLAESSPTDHYVHVKDCLHIDDIEACSPSIPDSSVPIGPVEPNNKNS